MNEIVSSLLNYTYIILGGIVFILIVVLIYTRDKPKKINDMKKTIDNLYGAKGGVNASRVAEVRTLIIPTYTSTQKQALAVAEGTVVYDSTLNKLCVYTAEAGGTSTGWETITSILE